MDKGSICTPKGFRASGIFCGIKQSSRARDLAIIFSDYPTTAAAVFTANQVKAASVLVSQDHIRHGTVRAVIANSGNANACTGEAGLRAAYRMAALTADEFTIATHDVAVASTGVIGVPLPIAAIESEIEAAVNALRADESGASAALEAIMTTDTRQKHASTSCTVAGTTVQIGAIVKGSGMIHPNMGTMLGFITTDLAIDQPLLDKALKHAVRRSFNRVTVDGDTSTNDMLLIMANGAARNSPLRTEGTDFDSFYEALEGLCVYLAQEMARDGEGAKKLLTVTVKGAQCEDDAACYAKTVAGSNLVKTAVCGADPNWGRIMCALGYAGIPFDSAAVSLAFSDGEKTITVCSHGIAAPFSEAEATALLSHDSVEIIVCMHEGTAQASAWGCDLTHEYVTINGAYRT
ncbi:glutamate N-acetyltransferase / amino-acid N-acetyltransferase [Pillotina sp. SPG140]